MSKIKELSKIKFNTRYKTPKQIEKEAIANPTNQKYDFKKPTMVSMTKQEMETLHQYWKN